MFVLCLAGFALPLAAQTDSARRDTTAPSSEIPSQAFDRVDRRARLLIATVECAVMTSQARAAGVFGPPDSLGRAGLCLRQHGRTLGAFLTPDSTFTEAHLLSLVDLTRRERYTGAVDTSAILAELHATRRGIEEGYEPFNRENRQFAPFSMRVEGDSIEVWLLPVEQLVSPKPVSLGGERGFVFTPDGKTLVRRHDAFDRYRRITAPDTGVIELQSLEDDVPLMSELMLLNRLYRQQRDVRLLLPRYSAQLAGPEPNSFWVMSRRRQ